jgi:hypothetical protein
VLLWLLLQADPAGLVDRLSSDDPEIRLKAELRLIETGPPARRPVERLLASEDSELRLRAERILQYLDWGITVEGRKRVDALLVSSRVPPDRDALEWPDPWDIFADEEAWKALGPSVAPYLMQLRSASKHPEWRRKLLNLASFGGGREALPAACFGPTCGRRIRTAGAWRR